jgi:molybdate transport system ATP-binding protein
MAIIQVKNLSVSIQSKIIFENVSFEIIKGKQYAIVGPSGSGKTILLHCLTGQFFFKGAIETKPGISIALVEQQHHFKNLSNTSSFYYQQRFNSMDAEDALTVQDYFQSLGFELEASSLFELLGLKNLFRKRLIQLSNGENKRVQLAIALLQKPDVLLLDNPFLGLDFEARDTLNRILESLAKNGISITMVTSAQLIPELITDVLAHNWKNQFHLQSRETYLQSHAFELPQIKIDRLLLEQLIADEDADFELAVKMKNIHVQYAENIILDKINWTVAKGERWCLSGPNGAGKSTLLSLINADNPQAYANEIYLFDKRRGRGESIWDIKKRIGYVSPELHLFFDSSITTFDAIASGLFDTIGLFRSVNEEQANTINSWMKLLKIDQLSNQLLHNLPLGKQRLVLLARALVKNPPLLILDEPAQGLDEEQSALFKGIIEQICEHSNKTLIYVTHLKTEIPSCVHKFIQLENGRIVNGNEGQ